MQTGSFLIAVIFLGIGAAVGALVVLLINNLTEKKAPSTPDSPSALYPSQAHVRRERVSGRLALEMEGQIFSNPQALSAEQRKKAEGLALELARWLGVQPVQPSSPVETHARPLPPAVEIPPVAPVSGQPGVYTTGSMVQQINDLLQEQLAGTPLAERSIRLADGLHQTVVVWIGAQRYEGIEAVPDPQVKAAIRAAVSEWERRSAWNSPSGQ